MDQTLGDPWTVVPKGMPASMHVSLSQNEFRPFQDGRGLNIIELPSCSWLNFSRDGTTSGDGCQSLWLSSHTFNSDKS